MSAPNQPFDPVEVAPLHPDEVARARDEALVAVAAAGDLDALKRVRLDHAGDRSPLALANREIGALPPQAKADAGRRVGQARAAVREALERKSTPIVVDLTKVAFIDSSGLATLIEGLQAVGKFAEGVPGL